MADNDVAEIRRNFYRKQGAATERTRIMALLKSAICFDYLDDGACDHASCHELGRKIREIKNAE